MLNLNFDSSTSPSRPIRLCRHLERQLDCCASGLHATLFSTRFDTASCVECISNQLELALSPWSTPVATVPLWSLLYRHFKETSPEVRTKILLASISSFILVLTDLSAMSGPRRTFLKYQTPLLHFRSEASSLQLSLDLLGSRVLLELGMTSYVDH